jgi:hypothetical protein
MSTSGLSQAGLGRMHDVMAARVEQGDVPGVVTIVSRRAEVHVDAIGVKAVDGSDPIRRDTIFRISSSTKPFAAVGSVRSVSRVIQSSSWQTCRSENSVTTAAMWSIGWQQENASPSPAQERQWRNFGRCGRRCPQRC